MTRRASVTLPLLAGVAALLLVLTGCGNTGSRRAQANDDSELHRYDMATVGDAPLSATPSR